MRLTARIRSHGLGVGPGLEESDGGLLEWVSRSRESLLGA
jgi:hypothetical protein